MANKSVVRLDNVKSVYTGHNFSVRATVELENGFVGALGDVEVNNRDVHALEAPGTGDSIVLIANPALIYDNARLGSGAENKYFMEAGECVRAYEIAKHDTFSVSQEGINGTAVVGQYVTADAGYKLTPAATKPATGFAAKVVRFDTVGGAFSLNTIQTPTVYAVLEVIQN